MDTKQLSEAILGGGLYSVNFFNGRLLAAEDLSDEQQSQREARQRLGQALGQGIAYGLEVAETLGLSTVQAPVVTVNPGLALNRAGQALRLSQPVNLSLVRPANLGTAPATSGFFNECDPLQSGVYVVGEGVYLLTLAPSKGSQGRAPVSTLGNGSSGGGSCNTRYLVEGVQFRLLQFNLPDTVLADENHLRNFVAYACLGQANLDSFILNPFAAIDTEAGLLDTLRTEGGLSDYEVPLAVLFWTVTGGLRFVDMWAVRRRATRPAITSYWDIVVGDQRRCLAEAMFLQFQAQVLDLQRATPRLETVPATRYFRFLPPAGVIPLLGNGTLRGFDLTTFFAGQVYRNPVFLEGGRLESLLRHSLDFPPIDLDLPEMFWLYRVRENRQAGSSAPSYLVFTSGQMPFYGAARYDVARAGFSNYISLADSPEGA